MEQFVDPLAARDAREKGVRHRLPFRGWPRFLNLGARRTQEVALVVHHQRRRPTPWQRAIRLGSGFGGVEDEEDQIGRGELFLGPLDAGPFDRMLAAPQPGGVAKVSITFNRDDVSTDKFDVSIVSGDENTTIDADDTAVTSSPDVSDDVAPDDSAWTGFIDDLFDALDVSTAA